MLLCYRVEASSPSLTQIHVLRWGYVKTQVTQGRPAARPWELCKCVTCAFGRVRRTRTVRNAVAVTKKCRNFGSFLWVQEQKTEQPQAPTSSKKHKRFGHPNIVSVPTTACPSRGQSEKTCRFVKVPVTQPFQNLIIFSVLES